MSADGELEQAARERLSALVDGELESCAVPQACAHWRQSEASRRSWHTYQLIGDVLRSDDLASDPARDAEFLHALRLRLGAEPVPLASLAPSSLDESSDVAVPAMAPVAFRSLRPERHRAWWLSTAVAAGFVVFGAGALLLTRLSDGVSDSTANRVQAVPMAQALQADEALGRLADAAVEEAAPTVVAGGELLRDARLDRYLAAHKQFAGTSALGVPSAYLRSATVNGADR